MTNKDLKTMIKTYSIEGDHPEDIASNLGVSVRTIYRYLKEIREEKDQKYIKRNNDTKEKLKLTKNENRPKLTFLSTPSHGYLLVPEEIMNKYPGIKKDVLKSDFSWYTNGIWYLEEDQDAEYFIDNSDYTHENTKVINSEDDIGLNVMSPHHPHWNVFYYILCVRLDSHLCNARSLKQAKFVLNEFFPEIDLGDSLEYFRTHGGFCDCEILMNVEDSSDNIKEE